MPNETMQNWCGMCSLDGAKGEGVWALMGSLETIIKGGSTSIWSKPCKLYIY
jgi:hypothetical protein